jgi:GTPase
LGHEFLRHIERTHVLIHVIDATAAEPLQNYRVIKQELAAYGHDLINRPQIVVLNKSDAVEPEKFDLLLSELTQDCAQEVLTISAVAQQGLTTLLNQVWTLLDVAKQDFAEPEAILVPFPG